jgi:hypothetical protein
VLGRAHEQRLPRPMVDQRRAQLADQLARVVDDQQPALVTAVPRLHRPPEQGRRRPRQRLAVALRRMQHGGHLAPERLECRAQRAQGRLHPPGLVPDPAVTDAGQQHAAGQHVVPAAQVAGVEPPAREQAVGARERSLDPRRHEAEALLRRGAQARQQLARGIEVRHHHRVERAQVGEQRI